MIKCNYILNKIEREILKKTKVPNLEYLNRKNLYFSCPLTTSIFKAKLEDARKNPNDIFISLRKAFDSHYFNIRVEITVALGDTGTNLVITKFKL